ncbi:hypothetical protein GGE20_005782 [Rhizobium leguminosarum]|uniref:hypothetical protein n=1 Tax=Rhizobium TaxID=379 RepID=UPI001621146A|nr:MULTISPECIES: hypothetical protein [Rhizobium]MBB4420791.1 hypothetical protein [Rhizobium leguminosarum]
MKYPMRRRVLDITPVYVDKRKGIFDTNRIGDEMVWATKTKGLELTKTTGHPPPRKPQIRGRAPATKAITFTPAELFGAMAKCSHLHVVNSAAVTSESETCRHLLNEYVDDDDDSFAILETADRLKDFSRTHLAGVVGAGISYLQMIRDGYTWCDHFENMSLAGAAPTKKSPDFVFSRRDDKTVALTESKATRGSSRKQFDTTVRRGYLQQVSPYLGMRVGSSVASHGFAIGSWMTSAKRAEIVIHHTAPPSGNGDGSDEGADPTEVRRGNYLNALTLLLGPDVSRAALSGEWSARGRQFVMARWLGHEWLLGFAPFHSPYVFDEEDKILWENSHKLAPSLWGFNRFALEWNVARQFFMSLERNDTLTNPLENIPEMDDRLIAEARSSDSAVFPDGFAVIGKDADLELVSVNPIFPQDLEQAKLEQEVKRIAVQGSEVERLGWDEATTKEEEEKQLQQVWLTD